MSIIICKKKDKYTFVSKIKKHTYKRCVFVIRLSKSISRVLYKIIIYLGALLPIRSSDLPLGGTSSPLSSPNLVLLQMGFTEPHSRLCAGELLPHLSILTFRRRRSISVALSLKSPSLGVTQHPALWSSDFPRVTTRLSDLLLKDYTGQTLKKQEKSTD